jgi:hypothetical protein
MGKHRLLTRRVEALEREAAPPAAPAPCFVMAEDEAEAGREVARIRAEHPDAPRTLFVMIGARGEEPGRPTERSA